MSLGLEAENGNPIILVVEDEMLLRLGLAHQLRIAGFDVIVAESGDEAVAILKANDDVELVLTDIRMPGKIDGAELARSVQAQAQHIKVVVLSAYVDAQQQLPVEATFQKPIRIKALLAKLRELLPSAPLN